MPPGGTAGRRVIRGLACCHGVAGALSRSVPRGHPPGLLVRQGAWPPLRPAAPARRHRRGRRPGRGRTRSHRRAFAARGRQRGCRYLRRRGRLPANTGAGGRRVPRGAAGPAAGARAPAHRAARPGHHRCAWRPVAGRPRPGGGQAVSRHRRWGDPRRCRRSPCRRRYPGRIDGPPCPAPRRTRRTSLGGAAVLAAGSPAARQPARAGRPGGPRQPGTERRPADRRPSAPGRRPALLADEPDDAEVTRRTSQARPDLVRRYRWRRYRRRRRACGTARDGWPACRAAGPPGSATAG